MGVMPIHCVKIMVRLYTDQNNQLFDKNCKTSSFSTVPSDTRFLFYMTWLTQKDMLKSKINRNIFYRETI